MQWWSHRVHFIFFFFLSFSSHQVLRLGWQISLIRLCELAGAGLLDIKNGRIHEDILVPLHCIVELWSQNFPPTLPETLHHSSSQASFFCPNVDQMFVWDLLSGRFPWMLAKIHHNSDSDYSVWNCRVRTAKTDLMNQCLWGFTTLK